MLRALNYAPYAIRHGWTPEQVDRLPADVVPYLLQVEDLLQEEAKRRNG